MHFDAIDDFDAAYANGRHIPGGDLYPDRWTALAAAFRAGHRGEIDVAYGRGARHRLDLFLPDGPPRGLFVFLHGGYWVAFDKSAWSHLAAGPLARGWAVAIPSYDLCPEATLSRIVRQTARAVTHAAARVAGPIVLSGHSAGGHLATSLVCEGAPLAAQVAQRVRHVVSISGLHDLRPLLRTAYAGPLHLTPRIAVGQSPALRTPRPHIRATAWVGADERPEFRRQSTLLATAWGGLGIATEAVTEAGRHHFDVIDGLTDPCSPLCRAALG